MRGLDFTSWESLLTTVFGLAIVTLIGIGIRLWINATVQQRRERLNRQINERLRTLIAAYKVLGGSFTGNLSVDPTHRRDLRHQDEDDGEGEKGSDRKRRIRDAVEAALSDIILLGTEEQVRLASAAVTELVGGRPVQTDALVVSLRNFIREALDLDPIPAGVAIPAQGPTRPGSGGSKSGRTAGSGEAGGSGGGRSGGGGGGGAGGGTGLGMGLGAGHADDPDGDQKK